MANLSPRTVLPNPPQINDFRGVTSYLGRLNRALEQVISEIAFNAVTAVTGVSSVFGRTGDVVAVAGDYEASEITFSPSGGLSATNVQTALIELDTEKQPLDADLTAIAALSTTAYGRALLTLADGTALEALLTLTASQIANVAAGGIAATDVQTALNELDTEKLASASYTAADVLAKLLTVDGSGSGLDADLLDGLSSAAFQPIDADLTAIAALTPTDSDFINFNAGVWQARNLSDILNDYFGGVANNQVVVRLAGVWTNSALTASQITNVAAGNIAATDVQAAINELDTEKQPLDSDLTTIAGLTATTDNFIQAKSSAWASRTVAQVLVDLAAPGTTFQPLDADLTAIAALTTTTAGRSILDFADPNADRVMVWDDSAGDMVGATVSTGLSISATPSLDLDSDLQTIAGLTATSDNFIQAKSSAWASRTVAQVLVDLAAPGTTFQPLDTDLTQLSGSNYEANSAGRFTALKFRTASLAINDDATQSFTAIGDVTHGYLMVIGNSSARSGVAYVDCDASPTSAILAGGANFAVTTGDLVGTTGTDTNVTVSAKNDGTVEIENRTGALATFAIVYFGR